MKNYLIRKINIIRPNRSLFNNSLKNDNSLKNICQRKQKTLCNYSHGKKFDTLTSNLGAVWLPVNQIYKTLYGKLSTQKDEQN